nr:hypothetical protein GCM10020093_085610 [Planobispora longispora]
MTARPDEKATTVKIMISGVATGTRFRLDVVAADGSRQTAGNWIVDEAAYDESGGFSGSTTIPPGGIDRFEVLTSGGRLLLTVPAHGG